MSLEMHLGRRLSLRPNPPPPRWLHLDSSAGSTSVELAALAVRGLSTVSFVDPFSSATGQGGLESAVQQLCGRLGSRVRRVPDPGAL